MNGLGKNMVAKCTSKIFRYGALETREMYWGKMNFTESKNCLDYMKLIELNKHRIRVTIWKAYYLLAYLLTPWCRVLLEKLTGLQLFKKIPTFHGTRKFITALTSVRHLSLSWARPIQSIYPHPTSWSRLLPLLC